MQSIIEQAWENRSLLESKETQDAINAVIAKLDEGSLRVAEPKADGSWQVNEWVKKAVVLYFPIRKMETIEVGPFEFHDKMALKKITKKKVYALFRMPLRAMGLMFQRCNLDAFLCEYWCLC